MYFSSDAALCICLWLCPFVLAALCALSLIRSGACFLIRAPDRVQSRGKKRTQRAHCAACQPHQRFSVRRPQAPNFPLTSYTHPHSHSHSHTPSSQLPPASPLASSSAFLPPSKIRPSKNSTKLLTFPSPSRVNSAIQLASRLPPSSRPRRTVRASRTILRSPLASLSCAHSPRRWFSSHPWSTVN